MNQNKYVIEKVTSMINSGALVDIKLFQVNENFFELPGGIWIIDGGIELQFPGGTLCFGWNKDIDGFDLINSKFKDLYRDSDYSELFTERMHGLTRLKNKTPLNHEFIFRDFNFIIDWTLKTRKESRLVEIQLDFTEGYRLQIASVDYELQPEEKPKEFRYDVSQDLLVTMNNPMTINK